MGAAGLLFNAKVVQAGSMYMIFMYAFLVSAMDIYHVWVVMAAVKSNNVQHVSIGAAGIPFNAKVVQAGNRSMTFMYALLVSVVTDHYVKMVTAAVKSKAVKNVLICTAGMQYNVDMIQVGYKQISCSHVILDQYQL